jgi:hypothetical protein
MRSLLFEDSVCMKSSIKVLVVELLISVIHKHPADHTPFNKKRHHCPYQALCDFLMFKCKVKKYQAGIDVQKIKCYFLRVSISAYFFMTRSLASDNA